MNKSRSTSMTLEERKKRLKALKKSSPSLSLYVHPPTRPVIIGGKRVIFSGPFVIYTVMAFIAGFLDANFFAAFDVYATMSTGNMVQGCLAAYGGNLRSAVFAFAMSFCTTIVGGVLSCVVMEAFPNKVTSFAVLSLCECFTCFLTAFALSTVDYKHGGQGEFAALTVAITNGALCQWVLKMGYTFPLYTINLLKVAESAYKMIRNISQGGAKLRGDMITVITMFVMFIMGCFFGKAGQQYLKQKSLLVVSGIHILLTIYYTITSPISPYSWALNKAPDPKKEADKEKGKDKDDSAVAKTENPLNRVSASRRGTTEPAENSRGVAASLDSLQAAEDIRYIDPSKMRFDDSSFMPSEVARMQETYLVRHSVSRLPKGITRQFDTSVDVSQGNAPTFSTDGMELHDSVPESKV